MGEARDSAMACYTPSTEVKFKKIMFPVFFSLKFVQFRLNLTEIRRDVVARTE